MTKENSKFFKKFEFTPQQVEQYFQNALRDLNIAKEVNFPEVRFSYSYQSLIKAGIVLIAAKEKVRVRSVPGHHIKLLERMSTLLQDEDILTIGNAMRTKRNKDLYTGGSIISEKEATDYCHFEEKILEKVKNRIF